MPIVKPFMGIRPKEEFVKEVSCLPYDVMSREEAREMAKSDKSFLRVVRSEIDLDENIDVHSEAVYEKAKENFSDFIKKGILKQEEKEVFYIYKQIMNKKEQTGICGCASIKDYENNIIKKHEFTRPEKEIDRIKNFEECSAHTEPVFFAYKRNEEMSTVINNWTKNNKSVYDFVSEEGVGHTVWVVDNDEEIQKIKDIFESMEALYIADGHHRTASAYQVGKKINENGFKEGEHNYILAVMFSDDQLNVMDYNRIVYDISPLKNEELIEKIALNFHIEKITKEENRPSKKHEFTMFLKGQWYKLEAKENIIDKNHPVKSLDADILQNNILNPLLGILDPRTSENIEFVGGIRGLDYLEKRCSEFTQGVAFALYPVTMSDIFNVSEADMVMPPKSTWFEPKLRSGLFIHKF